MVGGIVRDMWRWTSGKVEIVVEGTDSESGCFLQQDLFANGDSLTIKRGDTVWWQSKYAYWTTKDRSLEDVRIPRIGYSQWVEKPVCKGRVASNKQENK